MNWIKKLFNYIWGNDEWRGYDDSKTSTKLIVASLIIWLVSSVFFSIVFESSLIGGIIGLTILFIMAYLEEAPKREKKYREKIAEEKWRRERKI